MSQKNARIQDQLKKNVLWARRLWPQEIGKLQTETLKALTEGWLLSVPAGDLQYLSGKWYPTHVGLLRLAHRRRCVGIRVQPIHEFCDPSVGRWAFRATAYKSHNCRGFVGFGDADPTNVSALVRGAEMRVAETRAVNRALRKAYGIGICSVEEIGSFARPVERSANVRKLPPQPANCNGGPKLRDQLCLLIHQHRLDASLVKLYAAEFCGTENLQATPEQVESFIKHLAESAANDRDGLLCKLNSYAQKPQKGAA